MAAPSVAFPDRRVPLVFVGDLVAPALDDGDERHLRRSLRMAEGDELTLADGRGRHRSGRLRAVEGVAATGEILVEPERSQPLRVGFTPIKAQKPEWLAAKLTELGVDEIVLVVSERSVVRWDRSRADKIVERIEVAVREASMQCRRARLPVVEGPTQVLELLTEGVALAEPGHPACDRTVRTVLVGPEGGWAPEELKAAERLVGLPGRILRAETAVVVAGAELVGCFTKGG